MSSLFEFRNEVLGYLNRTGRDMVLNGVDLVISAANKAKREAERIIDFEAFRCQATLAVDLQDGALLSSAVLQGTSTPVAINRIERAFITKSGNSRPAELVTRATMFRRLGAAWDESIPWLEWVSTKVPSLPDTPIIFRNGTKLFAWPGSSAGLTEPVSVGLDIVKWSDLYTGNLAVYWNNGLGGGPTYSQTGIANNQPLFGYVSNGVLGSSTQNGAYYDPLLSKWIVFVDGTNSQSAVTPGSSGLYGLYTGALGNLTAQPQNGVYSGNDIFLDECVDWLLLSTLKRLNHFLKDANRTLVTNTQVEEAFRTMSAWNATQADLGDDSIDLD